MLEFKPLCVADTALLRSYYEHCPFRFCEYTAGIKLMWTSLRPAYAEAAGCLLVRFELDGETFFDYPVAGAEGDEDAALTALEQHWIEQGIAPIFSVIPPEKLPHLLRRYPYARVSAPRLWQDYLYHAEDMQSFAGRRYSGQRNHINNFTRRYPTAHFRPLTPEDGDKLSRFWREFEEQFAKGDSKSAVKELRLAEGFFNTHYADGHFLAGCMELDGRILSVALGERCGETVIVHIEKAMQEFEGIYPTMVREFARTFGGDALWFNREDDAANRGLRMSKLQYLPAEMGEKYHVELENELHHLREIPTLQTERLTLRPFTDADKPAYNAICLDDERNRWWGYDYRTDLGDAPLTEDYFLSVTREDFRRHLAVNFAICLGERCIGEAVLYRF
ncbi:MAG: GNAT family N-acetyltransferase, partial [Oscillospiraceae bacterium]|nr:GNAT family N-acetyltransferase [Oscillospiraceae bacterium]